MKNRPREHGGRAAWIAALVVLCLPGASRAATADSVEAFYRGKTVNLYISSSAGNGYDVYARLVARFLSDHIPGRPLILPMNMPTAEGRAAAADVYNAVAKDGLSIVALNRSVALDQVRNAAGSQVDISKFNWIGDPDSDNDTLTTWYTTGVRTIDDAKRIEVTFGATGVGNSAIFPIVANAILGTRFKIVLGYPGGSEADLAMEKGEVGGRDNAWGSWKSAHADWLRDHKINLVLQLGLRAAPDLPNVPLLLDLAANDEDRALVRLLSAPEALGHPLATSPGVPAERVQALRAAFDATMKDPEFLAAAKQQHREINPTSGLELEKIANDILSTPKPVRDRLVSMTKEAEGER